MTLWVSNLALTDYRSYREALVEFPAGVVVLQGANGRGKTNLVEAIAYLSTFSSHRSHSSKNLVRIPKGKETQPGGAVVRTRANTEGRSHLLELEIARGRANRARLNRSKVSPRDILGIIRVVVFAPEDLELLRGGPEGRRTFVDEVVLKLKPHHLSVLQEFGKVSRQRAAHLKEMGGRYRHRPPDPYDDFGSGGSAAASMTEIWDEQLAFLSATIMVHRLAVIEAMHPLVQDSYNALTGADRKAEIEYVSDLGNVPDLGDFRVVAGRFEGDPAPAIDEARRLYLEQMIERREQEKARGINLSGSHRDDILVSLDGLPVRGFASHGEIWSSALMLRLSEMELLRLDGDYPVLVLDDVFAELDESRREGLLACIDPVEQVFVTVAVENDLPEGIEASVFDVVRDQDGWSLIIPVSPSQTASEANIQKEVEKG